MQLSERLAAVAALAGACDCLADIGTDHGYVPIYLCQNLKIQTAIAMDVNKGPLERADKNIHAHNLEDRISTRLSDGLHALKPGEASCIVVAGMGGALTIKILEEGKEVASLLDKMVLQPQSEIHLVRKYLYENGYEITDEDMIFEDGKYYPMMLVKKSTSGKELSDVEYYFGPILLQKKNQVLIQFLDKEMDSISTIERILKEQNSERVTDRLTEVAEKKALIQRAKEMLV